MGYSTFSVEFLVEVHGFEGTWFQAKGTGCMVSTVWGTWVPEYWVHSFEGTGVSHYPNYYNSHPDHQTRTTSSESLTLT